MPDKHFGVLQDADETAVSQEKRKPPVAGGGINWKRGVVAAAVAGVLVSGCDWLKCKKTENASEKCYPALLRQNEAETAQCYDGLFKENPDFSDEWVKDIRSLSPTELEIVNAHCRDVLLDFFGNNINRVVRVDMDRGMPTLFDLPDGGEATVSITKPIFANGVVVPTYLYGTDPKFNKQGLPASIDILLRKSPKKEGGRTYVVVKSKVFIVEGSVPPLSSGSGAPDFSGYFQSMNGVQNHPGGHHTELFCDNVIVIPYKVAILPGTKLM